MMVSITFLDAVTKIHDRNSLWEECHHGKAVTVGRRSPWEEHHRGRDVTIGGTSPWEGRHHGRDGTVEDRHGYGGMKRLVALSL